MNQYQYDLMTFIYADTPNTQRSLWSGGEVALTRHTIHSYTRHVFPEHLVCENSKLNQT